MQWEKENTRHSAHPWCVVRCVLALLGEKGEQGRCSMVTGSKGSRRYGTGRESHSSSWCTFCFLAG